MNIWELEIGSSPVELKINAGAYKGNYDFGGLAITSLEVTDGASDVELAFSSPNQLEMETFRYVTGASNLEMTGLANANFESMTFRGGAGDFKLDFSGQLKRDTDGSDRIRLKSRRGCDTGNHFSTGSISRRVNFHQCFECMG